MSRSCSARTPYSRDPHRYLRENQKQLRAESYKGLADYVHHLDDGQPAYRIGKLQGRHQGKLLYTASAHLCLLVFHLPRYRYAERPCASPLDLLVMLYFLEHVPWPRTTLRTLRLPHDRI